MTDEQKTEVEDNAAQDENVITQPQGDEVAETEESTTSTENEPDGGSADDAGADDGKKKSRGVQERINELTANWRTSERRNEFLERQIETLQKQLETSKPKENAPEPTPKPKLENFESEDAYFEAVADWKAEQKLSEWEQKQQERETQRQEREREQANQQTRQQKQVAFNAAATKFAEEHPDFWTVAADPNVPITQDMMDVIMESDMGPEVAYHLGQHPSEATRIANLSPVAAAREIGRLEQRLSVPPKPKVSKAPDPTKTVTGSGESAAKDPDKMSLKQWMAQRNKELGIG